MEAIPIPLRSIGKPHLHVGIIETEMNSRRQLLTVFLLFCVHCLARVVMSRFSNADQLMIRLGCQLLGFGYAFVWGFAFWFPFRHDGVGILPGFAGVLFGGLIALFLFSKMNAVALAIGLPFALSAISYVCFRNRGETKSQQPNPCD